MMDDYDASRDPRRSVFVNVNPATGVIQQWSACFVAPEIEGTLAVELPPETDPYSLLYPVAKRIDLAALKQRDGKPPLGTIATTLDS